MFYVCSIHSQLYRQTNTSENITSFAKEVIIQYYSLAAFLYCCPDCLSCPINAIQCYSNGPGNLGSNTAWINNAIWVALLIFLPFQDFSAILVPHLGHWHFWHRSVLLQTYFNANPHTNCHNNNISLKRITCTPFFCCCCCCFVSRSIWHLQPLPLMQLYILLIPATWPQWQYQQLLNTM